MSELQSVPEIHYTALCLISPLFYMHMAPHSFLLSALLNPVSSCISLPGLLLICSPGGGDDDDDHGSNNDDQGDDGDQSEQDDDGDDGNDNESDSASGSEDDNQKRMTFPNETPVVSIQFMAFTASGTSKSSLASVFSSATSWCGATPAADRDDKASSFCGSFPVQQSGGEPQPTPTKPARKRNINFFANAAPLTTTTTERASSTTEKVKRTHDYPHTITFSWSNGLSTATISDVSYTSESLHAGTSTFPSLPPPDSTTTIGPIFTLISPITSTTPPIIVTPLGTSTTTPTAPSPSPSPSPPPSPPTAPSLSPRLRRRKLAEPQVGTCTLFSGSVDCVASKAWCVLFLLLIGIGVGVILTVGGYYSLRWAWRKFRVPAQEKGRRGEKGRERERSKARRYM